MDSPLEGLCDLVIEEGYSSEKKKSQFTNLFKFFLCLCVKFVILRLLNINIFEKRRQ